MIMKNVNFKIKNVLKGVLLLLFVLIVVPTTVHAQVLDVTHDSWVDESNPDTNNEGNTDMQVSSDAANTTSFETYLKFDISSITDYVVDGKLILAAAQKTDAGWTGIDSLYVEVFGCFDDTWDETTITWNNKPASKTMVLAEINVTDFQNYAISSAALTDYINSAVLNDDRDSITFIIKGKHETPGSRIWISDKGWIGADLDLTTTPISNSILGSDDSWVGSAAPDANNDGETDMHVTLISGDTCEAYVKFDLSGVQGMVTNASFSLRGDQFGKDSYPTVLDNFYVQVLGTVTDWDETTITWNTKPDAATTVLAEENINGSGWYAFSDQGVVDYINDALSDGKFSVTFIVRGKDETAGTRAWFSDKGWAKPILELVTVEVDQSIGVTDDSWVGESDPTTNHEGETDMQVMTDVAGGATKLAYFNFSLTGINGYIDNAVIQIKGDQFKNEPYTTVLDNFYVELFGCNDVAWDEAAITWDTKPDSSTRALDMVNVNYSGWHSFSGENLVNYLNDALMDGRETVTFILRGKDETPDSRVWISDKGWAGPKLKLSVVPTDLDVQVGPDTWVGEADPTANHDTETDMQIIKDIAGGDNKEAYITFDLSAVTNPLHTAVLKLKGDQKVDETYSSLDNFYIEIFGIDDVSWDETTMTWDTKPTAGTESLGHANVIFSGWHSITSDALTQYVNDAISNGDDSVSFAVKGMYETPGSRVWISDKGWEDPVLSLGVEVTDPPAVPEIAVASGTYAGPIEVFVTCDTAAASIFYTLDGTDPTNSSTKYTGGIDVSETGKLKAIAYVGNVASEGMDSASFTILPLSETLLVSEDSWLSEEFPDSICDGQTDIQIVNDATNGKSKEGILKFDLTGISGYAAGASLHLRGGPQTNAPYTEVVDSFMIQVYAAVYDWDETTVNWSKKPRAIELLGEEDVETDGWHIISSDALAEYVSAIIKSELTDELSLIIKGKHETPLSRIWMSDKGWADAKLSLTLMEEGAVLETSEESYVKQADEYTNFNDETDADMHVRLDDTNTDSREVVLKFDISAASEATKVTLGFVAAQDITDYTYVEDLKVGVYGSTDSTWSELGVIWANKPAATTAELGQANVDSIATWYQFGSQELTDFVNSRIALGSTSVSFIIKGLTESADARVWVSSPNWKAPQLSFYYGGDASIDIVTFSPDPGIYDPPSISVTLSTLASGANIYYTLDGSIPTEASTLYTEAIIITEDNPLVEITAVAIVDGKRSYISTGSYYVGNQEAYTGTPWPIPGRVNAAWFDLGGPGVSHYEADDNLGGCPGASLSESRVDHALIDGCCMAEDDCGIGWSVDGEWVEYTVNAAVGGCFTFVVGYVKASEDAGSEGYLKIEETDVNNAIVDTIVENFQMVRNVEINDWGADPTTVIVATAVPLTAGDHTLRFSWVDAAWNLAFFEVHSAACEVGVSDFNSSNGFNAYPNPVNNELNVDLFSSYTGSVEINLVDLTGRRVISTKENKVSGKGTFKYDVSDLAKGIYFLRVKEGSEIHLAKIVVD